jgi:hypothetical protein
MLSRRGSMFAQWKPCPDLLPRPCLSAESSSRHLQFPSVATTSPFLFRGRTGVTPLLFRVDFVGMWELQDDGLQPQHQLLFGDGDTVVELVLKPYGRTPAKGLAPSRNRAVMLAMLAVTGSPTVAERTARLLYEHASTWRAVVGNSIY